MRGLKQRCDPGPRLNISCHRPRRRTIQYSNLDLIGEGLRATGGPLARAMTACSGERLCLTLPLLPHDRPYLGLQHLAVIVLWQCIEIDVALRPLETRDRGQAMRVEPGVVGSRAIFQHHAGDDDFAPVRIWNADR